MPFAASLLFPVRLTAGYCSFLSNEVQWIRRNSDEFDRQLKKFLFTDRDIAAHEKEIKHE